jgi:hypothetical protein
MHYTTTTTIDPPQSQRLEPTTMHYTTIDEPEKTKIPKTLHYTPLLTTSTDTSTVFIWLLMTSLHTTQSTCMMRQCAIQPGSA